MSGHPAGRVCARFLTEVSFLERIDAISAWFEETLLDEWQPWINEPRQNIRVDVVGLFPTKGGQDVSYSSERLHRFMADVRRSRYHLFSLTVSEIAEQSRFNRPGIAKLTVEIEELQDPELPNSIEAQAAVDVLVGSGGGMDVLVASLTEPARLLGEGSGAIYFLEAGGPHDPFDWAAPDLESRSLVAQSNRWLQGVFWGNLLGPQHLAALGGIDRVLADQPAPICKPLDGPDGPLAYLQASDRLETCTLGELETLHRYLAPVLPHSYRDKALATEVMSRQVEDIRQAFA